MGIEAHSIEGTSELKHRWMAYKVAGQYKTGDLNKVLYIKYGFKGKHKYRIFTKIKDKRKLEIIL